MLRLLVVVLLLANLAFWAWTSGALDSLGLGPERERDPARLLLQVRPETVRIVPGPAAEAAPPRSAFAASAAATAGGTHALCLETSPLAPTAIDAAERLLASAALPASLWARTTQDSAAQYAVVLGPFNSAESQQKKAEEIGRLRIATEALELPAETAAAQGQAVLALGRYDSRSAAEAALASFVQRGVRTARVALLAAALSQTRLRIASATAAQAEQLRALNDPALGAGFGPCAAGSAGASR